MRMSVTRPPLRTLDELIVPASTIVDPPVPHPQVPPPQEPGPPLDPEPGPPLDPDPQPLPEPPPGDPPPQLVSG